jgi:hypothetical protein
MVIDPILSRPGNFAWALCGQIDSPNQIQKAIVTAD